MNTLFPYGINWPATIGLIAGIIAVLAAAGVVIWLLKRKPAQPTPAPAANVPPVITPPPTRAAALAEAAAAVTSPPEAAPSQSHTAAKNLATLNKVTAYLLRQRICDLRCQCMQAARDPVGPDVVCLTDYVSELVELCGEIGWHGDELIRLEADLNTAKQRLEGKKQTAPNPPAEKQPVAEPPPAEKKPVDPPKDNPTGNGGGNPPPPVVDPNKAKVDDFVDRCKKIPVDAAAKEALNKLGLEAIGLKAGLSEEQKKRVDGALAELDARIKAPPKP